MAKSITKRTLTGFRGSKVNTRYFLDLVNQIANKQQNFIEKIKQGKTYWKLNIEDNMKFNAVVGNPPYQLTKEGTSDNPIYHLFMDVAFKLSDKVSFITPARFLFNAGKTPKEWNTKVLNDAHFRVVWYKGKSTDVFPNVDIKGGVAVTLRDTKQNFGVIGIFTERIELNSILKKVSPMTNIGGLDNIIYTQNKFDLNQLYKDHPHYKNIIGSEGNEKRLTSSIFDKLDIFKDKPTNDKNVKVLGLIKNTRHFKFVPSVYIEKHENLHAHKVLLPKSNGTGTFGESLSTPVIGEPGTGFTQSFISVGSFVNQAEAKACLNYLKTKFARCLLGILKVTQDNSKEVWKYVPLQDFTSKSDINWDQSIEQIDKQLFSKYKLTEEEINFINTMVKPMN